MDKGFVQTLHNSNQCSTVTGGCTPPMGVGGWGTPGVNGEAVPLNPTGYLLY